MKRNFTVLFWVFCFVYPSQVLCEDRLVLMSPHPDGVQNEFEMAFHTYYQKETGRNVTLEWLDIGGTSSILRYIKSEFRSMPSGIGIDLFFGGGIDPYMELSELGYCMPFKLPDELLVRMSKTIGGIPLYDPEFRWYGATLAGFGIVYNRKVLEILNLPVPMTWADLGDPSQFSWVGSGDPRSSGSVHMAYEIILQAYGWEKGWDVITTLGANVRNFGSGGSQAPKDVAIGEVAYGLSIDFYAWAQVARIGKEYIGFTMPDNLTIVNPDGLAILKGAPNLEVAKEFVKFVMSDVGQKLWFLKKGVSGGPLTTQLNRFTILSDLYERFEKDEAAVTLNPFNWSSTLVYNSEVGSARWSVLNDLIGVLIIDSHSQLQYAWKRVMADGVTVEEIRRLSVPPITESECLRLSSLWHDVELRSKTLGNWTEFARKKYGKRYQSPISKALDFLTIGFPIGISCAMISHLMGISFRVFILQGCLFAVLAAVGGGIGYFFGGKNLAWLLGCTTISLQVFMNFLLIRRRRIRR